MATPEERETLAQECEALANRYDRWGSIKTADVDFIRRAAAALREPVEERELAAEERGAISMAKYIAALPSVRGPVEWFEGWLEVRAAEGGNDAR